jgi:7-cyano-7-deazaguanine synthase in queuosine biosynthesis
MGADLESARPSSSYRVSIAPSGHILVSDGKFTRNERTYSLARYKVERQFGTLLPPELADLLDISHAVYFADRLARRPLRRVDGASLNWARAFEVSLALRQPGPFQSEPLRSLLTDTLEFLTGDEWHFSFFSRDTHAISIEQQGYLFETKPDGPASTALFSGGLDAFAGLVLRMAADSAGHFILVSAVTTSRIAPILRQLISGIRSRLSRPVTHIQVPFGIRQRQTSYDHDEPSQRARGFIFPVLGAIAALVAGCNALEIYENGIGAVNLPFNDAQFSSQSTKSTDPRYLGRLSELMGLVIERRFSFCNPFLFSTKGEMCDGAARLGFGEMSADTVSCDGFPQRIGGVIQCGLCTSCVLRRLSLKAAGLHSSDSRKPYRDDLFSLADSIPAAKLIPWRALAAQALELESMLSAPEPWQAFARRFPQILPVAAVADAVYPGQVDSPPEARLIDLYRRYFKEWTAFPVPPSVAPSWHAA